MAELSIYGRCVAYVEQGSGPPIVLLHAGAGSGKQWIKTSALLQDRYRVLAPDLWGFGGTESWSSEQELTHDDQADLVAEVIERLCGEPVHLVGHSYGGATAVRVILKKKQLVRTAVLIEPILTPLLRLAGEEERFCEYFEMANAFLRSVADGNPDEGWRGFLDYRNGAGTWEALPETSKERFRASTDSSVAGFRSNLSNPTSIHDLEQICIPTLVMCGEKTTLPDRRVAEIVQTHIPQCRFKMIPGAEHMSPLSHPAFIAEAIEHHLATAG